jgi:hypothetical protein
MFAFVPIIALRQPHSTNCRTTVVFLLSQTWGEVSPMQSVGPYATQPSTGQLAPSPFICVDNLQICKYQGAIIQQPPLPDRGVAQCRSYANVTFEASCPPVSASAGRKLSGKSCPAPLACSAAVQDKASTPCPSHPPGTCAHQNQDR